MEARYKCYRLTYRDVKVIEDTFERGIPAVLFTPPAPLLQVVVYSVNPHAIIFIHFLN